MSIIKILSENLVNQIAAGEVIERPASVVKELVENSLDAGAKKVVVEIEEAGKKLIRIFDDGQGIAKDDLKLAIQRHATSKITQETDLWKINSLGFRGEALASICSVAKVKIASKYRDSEIGQEIRVEGGKVVSEEAVQMNVGTKIEIEDLFFNTPARKKYLKKDSTELRQITALFNHFALANPEISFVLKHNGKILHDLVEVFDLEARIQDIFGQNTAEAMLPIFYQGPEFKLSGFVGKPVISRSNSQHQYLFVNKRSIQHYLLSNRIKAAFHSMLMEHKKPFFILNIEIDPALIDVNVHPRKIEIRFEDEKSLISIVYHAVKNALDKAVLIPKGYTESQNYMRDSFPRNNSIKSVDLQKKMDFSMGKSGNLFGNSSAMFESKIPKIPENLQSFESFNERNQKGIIDSEVYHEGNEGEFANQDSRPQIQAIAQIARAYIVAQDQDGLVLVDQHAAHERVRFEELIDQFESQKKSVQRLLAPVEILLTHEEKTLLEENLEYFENLGFEISDFSEKSFAVYAVPSFFVKEDLEEVINGVLDDLKVGRLNDQSGEVSKLQGHREEILTYMSCRSAIKFGQELSLEEMQVLINQMDSLKRPYTCPHGRPTMISLNFQELEKMFGRK